MESIKTSSKGQMVIPKSVREALGIHTGTQLQVELLPDRAFRVSVARTDQVAQVDALAGCLAHRGQAMTPTQEQAAVLQAVRSQDERTKGAARKRR